MGCRFRSNKGSEGSFSDRIGVGSSTGSGEVGGGAVTCRAEDGPYRPARKRRQQPVAGINCDGPFHSKLLEEDEDESMHSGVDVEAFQAALNRDIEGDASNSQQSSSNTAALSQGSNQASSQSVAQWPTAGQEGNTSFQKQDLQSEQTQQQTLSETEKTQHGAVATGSQQQVQQPNDVPQQLNRLPPPPQQLQDDRQQGVPEQIPASVPQTNGIQNTGKTPIPSELERTNNQDSESQYAKLQKMSNQQSSGAEQPNSPMIRGTGKQVPFAVLLPALLPQLDKDRAMQLHTLYGKLKKNEIAKDGFVRNMRDIVGDQMLRLAVNKLQVQMSSNQFPLQSQAGARPPTPRMPSIVGATQFSGPHSLAKLHQKGPNSLATSARAPSPSVPMQTNSNYFSGENKAQKPQELDRQSDSSFGVLGSQISSSGSTPVNQERGRSSIPAQGINRQQQHFPQNSLGMYGSDNYHTYSGSNVNTPGSSLKPQPHDSQMRQIPHNQSIGSNPVGGSTQAMNMMNGPKLDRQNSSNDPNRLQGTSISRFSSGSVPWQASPSKELNPGSLSSATYVKQESVDQGAVQHRPHLSATQGVSTTLVEQGNVVITTPTDEPGEKQSSRVGFSQPSITTQMDSNVLLGTRNPSVPAPTGVNARTPPKKPVVGQKKPLEALGSSPPPSSKKQKVSGAFADQSIEQLNDVTAVSGVNLREEEQLLSGPKDESRVSEASRRVVQEEEERLFLKKTPLQKKLAEIMAKSGLKNISNYVERCLSLSVEERMRGFICNLIRLSKQRVDVEKPRHRTLITSAVRQQIIMMNQNARGEWEKRLAEVEKLRELDKPEAETSLDGDKEKDDSRVKVVKVNKEDDDKMRTTAANVAARAAVGGDDMLSKWQLMAQQARQKREGGTDVASGSQTGKDENGGPLSASGKSTKDNQESEKSSHGPHAPGASKNFGQNQGGTLALHTRVARTISVKDVIAVLEREAQMSKSTLIYSLYEKTCSESKAE